MRVLFLSDFFFPMVGGIETRALPYIQAMRHRGHEFLVVTNCDPNGELEAKSNYDGLCVMRFPLSTAIRNHDLAQLVEQRRRIAALKHSFAPQLVHAFVSGPLAMAHLETEGATPAPFLASFTVWLDGEAESGTLIGRVFRAADWTTANSTRLLERMRARAPEIAQRSSVVYSGNVWPDLVPAPLNFTQPPLLCIGRLVEEKGFDLAIRAMPSIARRFPRTRMIIAGDGPCRSDLEALAQGLGVAEMVEFLGWVEPKEIPRLVNQSVMLLVPSRWEEAFASVTIQAAQMGRPTIAAAGGGMAEAIVHGTTGLLVENEDSDALADSVIRLLADPAMTVAMGRNARERARSLFSWNRYLDEFDGLYSRLVPTATGRAMDTHPGVRF